MPVFNLYKKALISSGLFFIPVNSANFELFGIMGIEGIEGIIEEWKDGRKFQISNSKW